MPDVRDRVRSPRTTHSRHPVPSGARFAVLGLLGAVPGSRQQTARFHHLFSKVSQNDEVSLKSVNKACHAPYLQNGLQKSPLEILRFPYFVAFSHKELMGLFKAHADVYCQNDEVSPECTPARTRERVVRYPHVTDAASCLCRCRSSSDSARGTRSLIVARMCLVS